MIASPADRIRLQVALDQLRAVLEALPPPRKARPRWIQARVDFWWAVLTPARRAW